MGVLLVKVLVAWQQILKTKVFSEQKGQIKGGRGNVLLFCSFCGSEGGKRLFESFTPEYSGQMFTAVQWGKLEHQFRHVPVSKGTTRKKDGIPEKDIKTETLVSTVTTPETHLNEFL